MRRLLPLPPLAGPAPGLTVWEAAHPGATLPVPPWLPAGRAAAASGAAVAARAAARATDAALPEGIDVAVILDALRALTPGKESA